VDDAYSAWFNAHSRCSEALRAWQEAGTDDDRAVAYLLYVAELDREETAAIELAAHHEMPRAA
jgi:hypothetical protein